jgi:hypothetical protein
MKTGNNSYYTSPEEALEQGDIFRVDLVAPGADEVQRIFRSKDGRHGSVVFEENCDGMVFSRAELDSLLESIPRTALHTKPFYKTPDGHEEMVVVFSRLFRYFIIATQTCDISGKDKAPYEWATILPVITLYDLCRIEPMVFASTPENITIDQFVKTNCEDVDKLDAANEIKYVPILRQTVKEYAKSAQNKKVREDFKHLNNYLSNYYNTSYMFSLPANETFHFPESYVDFTSAFTVPTSKLLAIKGLRLLRIADPYRNSFAQKFGLFFSRIAVPKPMRPT